MTVRRAQISALLVITGFIASALAFSSPAEAGARHLQVEPAIGLDNQAIHVTWTGFDPGHTVTLFQCKGVEPHSLSDCYKELAAVTEFGTGTDHATTGADGTGSAAFEVRPGLQLPSLGCSTRSPCSVIAFENDGSALPATGLPATAVTARLDFAPSPADCPKVSTPDVTTAGESSASHALYAWAARVCSGTAPLSLDYTESSSPEGRANFLKGLVDVGLTSTAPTGAEIAAGNKRTFTAAPIDLTGVVVAFNVSDTLTHQQITDMNLTPRLVAILLAGGQFGGPEQSLFSDPEFVALNPGHHWPSHVEPPLLRSERNADAFNLTNWLNKDASARNFLGGTDRSAAVDPYWKNISYPTDVFEARDPNTLGSYNPRSGTLTNARRLFNFQPPGDAVISPNNDGLLGVTDLVTAEKFGLPTAKLRPAAAPPNAAFVAADTSGLLAGYRAMTTTGDKLTKVANSAAIGGYPLVKIDYALVPTSKESPAKARNISRFLEYAAGSGQSLGVLSPGYVALPDDLRAQVAAAQRSVEAGAGTPPMGPPTGPTATPPATTPPVGQSTSPGSQPGGGGQAPLGGTSTGSNFGPGSSFGTNGSSSSSDAGGPSSTRGVASDGGSGLAAQSAAGSTPEAANGSGNTARRSSGAAAEVTATNAAMRPIGRFGGAEAQRVLPSLIGSGAAALAVGPALSLWLKRKRKHRPTVLVEGATP